MGGLSVCCRVFLVIVNIFFLTIGLIFFGLGLFIRFGDAIIDDYVDSVKKSLQESTTSNGMGTLDFSNFDISEILLPLSLGLIFFGLMLIVVTVLGCCGACCKIKYMLIAYVIICLVLLVAQIIVIGILYGSPDTFHDPAKKRLKDGIQADYMGLNGTNIVSLGWNILMQQVKCCGVDNYDDFTGAPSWLTNYGGGVVLKTPMACCKTLPTSSNFQCATTTGATDDNNYMSKGCYDKIWDDTLGNGTIMIAVLVGVGVFQFGLLFSGIFILYTSRDNKTDVEHPSKPDTKQSKSKGRRQSPVVSPSDRKPNLKF